MDIKQSARFECFGLDFEAFELNSGETVYGKRATARVLGIPITSFHEEREAIKTMSEKRSRTKKASSNTIEELRGAIENTLPKQRGKNSKGDSYNIMPISKAELLCWMIALAESGNQKFAAMRDAGLVTVFNMAEDAAFGRCKTREQYLSEADALQQIIEEHRNKLRDVTQRITKPVLACNVFKKNNDFIYGEGKNRNSYDGEDAALKHIMSTNAEMLEVGARLVGASVDDSVNAAHSFLKKQFPEALQ